MKNTNRRPQPNEYGQFYKGYIDKVKTDDLYGALADGQKLTVGFFKNMPTEKWEYKYAPGKWTVKELLQHLIDCERVFAYRALCIARNDKTPLPGFDENLYADNCQPNSRTPDSMIAEYQTVRDSTLHLFRSLENDALGHIGTTSGQPASPLSIGFVIAGHELHHIDIIKERYLSC